jgi:hypothetical protein
MTLKAQKVRQFKMKKKKLKNKVYTPSKSKQPKHCTQKKIKPSSVSAIRIEV